MKRAGKPKIRGGGKLSRKEKDDIIFYVIKKLFPRFAGLLMSAVIDELHPTDEEIKKVIDTANRYADFADQGLIDIEDLKKNIENKTGRKLENLMKWGDDSGKG